MLEIYVSPQYRNCCICSAAYSPEPAGRLPMPTDERIARSPETAGTICKFSVVCNSNSATMMLGSYIKTWVEKRYMTGVKPGLDLLAKRLDMQAVVVQSLIAQMVVQLLQM